MLFMWVLGVILGVIIIACLIFGWYSLNDYSWKKRLLILSGIVAGVILIGLLSSLLVDSLGTFGLIILCTLAFVPELFRRK
jgi:hypothetical protein